MIKDAIYPVDIDFEYKLWKNRLSYYQNELLILQHRLKELLDEHPELLETTQRFNKLIDTFISREIHLQNLIKVQEESIDYYLKDYPISPLHEHFREHEKIKENIEQLDAEYAIFFDEFIENFNRY
ncbi:hypothetical protein AAG747_09820 [Rapidithrix thailandica]|uniref:Uncharacterized protein n=1 Tax=Rapidithrix thailandica TaxID=413964 RepID=A0AAW9RWY6_9BACT